MYICICINVYVHVDMSADKKMYEHYYILLTYINNIHTSSIHVILLKFYVAPLLIKIFIL